MHPTAMNSGKLFFDTYVSRLQAPAVVEIGSQDVNGSLRSVCPENVSYTGLDFVPGKGVDVVISDPYSLPLADESADVVVSSSCFEHSEMFWLVFGEILRILKPTGLFYLNVPSNGMFHRYPVDCWRFYPDSGAALVTWGKRCGHNPALLESFIGQQYKDVWNDFVAVFVKDAAHVSAHPLRMMENSSFENGITFGFNEVIRPQEFPEDIRRIHHLNRLLDETRATAAPAKDAAATVQPTIGATAVRRLGAFVAKTSQHTSCGVCGGSEFLFYGGISPTLVNQWQISAEEAEYIGRQQSKVCRSCGCNLRSIALANAIRSVLGTDSTLLEAVKLNSRASLDVLELNEAGMLSPLLKAFQGYVFGAYPEVDMLAMPYANDRFDLIVHSDTLEHVSNPVHALTECRRVLRPGGALCYTIPIIVGRMTRSREGLPDSFHGDPAANASDYKVFTEYGADAWTQLIRAGFSNVRIHAVEYPAATALVAIKD